MIKKAAYLLSLFLLASGAASAGESSGETLKVDGALRAFTLWGQQYGSRIILENGDTFLTNFYGEPCQEGSYVIRDTGRINGGPNDKIFQVLEYDCYLD